MSEDPPLPDRLRVLYSDDQYVAIYKPPGALVHRTPLDARETLSVSSACAISWGATSTHVTGSTNRPREFSFSP